MTGYYIYNRDLKLDKTILLVIISIISFVTTVFIQYLSCYCEQQYNIWYNFVLLFICAVCIFKLFCKIKNKEEKSYIIRITSYLSKISLGIFFMHKIFLEILFKITIKIDINNPLEATILCVLSLILSVLFISIFSKFKFIKEKIFLIKDKL